MKIIDSKVFSCFTVSSALIVALSIPNAAFATPLPSNWILNGKNTHVNFSIDYFKQMKLKGEFHDVAGSIYYDEKHPYDTKVNFTVQTASVDTKLRPRDAFLRRKELLNTKQFPSMQFKSTSLKLITATEGYVTGDFTALGQTHPLTVKVKLEKISSGIASQPNLSFTATGSVTRQTYGVTAFSDIISNTIPLNITGILVPR